MVSKSKNKPKTPKGTIITKVIFRPKSEKSGPKIPSTRKLVKDSIGLISRYKALFALLGLVYLITTWILVALPFSSRYVADKGLLELLQEDGLGGAVGVGTLLMGSLAGEYTAPQTEGGQILGALVALLFALALIFAVRHLIAHENDAKVALVGVRDVLYNSPAPLISVFFTLALTVVAMLPAALGVFLVTFVFSIDIPWWQQIMPAITGVALVIVSLFWLVRMVFAIFVVTLPGARPIESIKETKGFVTGKRWGILWRLLFGGLIFALAWVVMFIPFLLLDLWVNIDWLPLVPIAIGLINTLIIVVGTVYMYKLYRSLL